nr:Rv3235 family protein [uncultured Actinoplanes sp.]
MRRTIEIAPGGPRPPISLRPAPVCEPPYDDELEPTVWASAHQLAFDWSSPAERTRRRPSSPEPTGPPRHRPAVAGASHEAKLAVRRFVRMYVEVLNGYRPVAHMRRLAVPAEAAGVLAQVMAARHRVTEMRRRMQAPARRPLPVAVIRLRLCEPRPGAVEAAVAMVIGDRTWAMALRMEEHHQSWCATTLRLV